MQSRGRPYARLPSDDGPETSSCHAPEPRPGAPSDGARRPGTTGRRMAAGAGGLDTLAVSIHGPAGVLDLAVPPGRPRRDLAREYAAQSGARAVPAHVHPARPAAPLRCALATPGSTPATSWSPRRRPPTTTLRPSAARARRRPPPGPLSALWFWVAGVPLPSRAGSPPCRGRLAPSPSACCCSRSARRPSLRTVRSAPAWPLPPSLRPQRSPFFDPIPERLPMVLGMRARGGVTAAVARALAEAPTRG